jgi:hypothetical protein
VNKQSYYGDGEDVKISTKKEQQTITEDGSNAASR